MPLLSYPDERIVNEVLAFLKALLESGNENIQKGFIDLQKSHDNPMFPSLHEMLHRSTLLYKERYVWCEYKNYGKKIKCIGTGLVVLSACIILIILILQSTVNQPTT